MRCVDLFAGAGGMTEGAVQAGVIPVWAGNHWPFACQTNSLSHPGVPVVCQDLRLADWRMLPEYELLLAAPCCQGHSRASQPNRRRKHSQDRATAWAVIDCAEVTSPLAILVENVPQFRDWPLYARWRGCLEDLGYELEEHVLCATDYGVPQRRHRLFVTGTLTRFGSLGYQRPQAAREPAIGPCIDWESPMPWLDVSAATRGIQARIARGRRNYGSRFLTQHVTNHPGVPLDEPIRTVTTKCQWNLVDGKRYRPLTVREHARAMGFPDSFQFPAGANKADSVRALGNAVCPPVAADLVGALVEHLQLDAAVAA